MTYLRSLFLNFLIVFFINNVMPGIKITNFENVPNIGYDIMFAVIVGFLNASVFLVVILFEIKHVLQVIVSIAFLISFLSYGIIAYFDFGIKVTTFSAFFWSALIVFLVSVFSNHLEYKHIQK